jgi:hypothetical protein
MVNCIITGIAALVVGIIMGTFFEADWFEHDAVARGYATYTLDLDNTGHHFEWK